MSPRLIKCPKCNISWGYDLDKENDYIRDNDNNIIGFKCYKCNENIKIYNKKIYLARSSECGDLKYKYPIHVKTHYDTILNIIDPFEYEKQNIKDIFDYEKIVNMDKELIKNCDIFIANIMTPSCGTISEIIYAYSIYDIPTYIINPNRVYLNDPWLKYHSNKIFDDVDICFQYIIDTYCV